MRSEFPTLPGYTPLEVRLKSPDDFLKVRETLTRIGVASARENVLYQSCHILHKQGAYYVVGFKELFLLDGKEADIAANDLQRRNTIAALLQDWKLLEIVDPEKFTDRAPISQVKVIPFSEKANWSLVPKYTLGKKP